jgi:hypothetical protein
MIFVLNKKLYKKGSSVIDFFEYIKLFGNEALLPIGRVFDLVVISCVTHRDDCIQLLAKGDNRVFVDNLTTRETPLTPKILYKTLHKLQRMSLVLRLTLLLRTVQ